MKELESLHLRRSLIRHFVRQEMQTSISDNDSLKFIDNAFNKKNSHALQTVWLVGLIVCFTVCCYQTIERIQYYFHGHFKVEIEYVPIAEKEPFELLLFGLDTQLLSEYWKQIDERPMGSLTKRLACPLAVKGIIHEEVKVENYTQLWSQSNISKNFQHFRVKQGKTVLHETSMANGIYEKEETTISFKYKNTVFGNMLIIRPDIKLAQNMAFHVRFKKNGSCINPFIGAALKASVMPYQYTAAMKVGIQTELQYFFRKYQFLPTRSPFCELNKKKQMQCYEECVAKQTQLNHPKCRLPYMKDKNLPDCGLELDKQIVAKVHEDSFIREVSTLPSLECGCLRPCQSNVYLLIIHSDDRFEDVQNGKEFLSIHITVLEDTFIKMTEIYIYPISNLLRDFGGNLGFSVGFSLLSIIEIAQFVLLLLYKYFKPSPLETRIKKKIINQMHLAIQKKNAIADSQREILQLKEKPVLQHLFYLILIFISVLLAFYVSTERISFYLTEPTRFVVIIQENNTLYLPNVIACMDGSLMIHYRRKYAKNIGTNECKINFINLMNMPLQGKNISIENVWRLQTPVVDTANMEIAKKITSIKTNVSWHKKPMHTGTCFESDIAPVKYAGTAAVIFFGFLPNRDKTCKTDMYEIYLKQGEGKLPSILRSRRNIKQNTFTVLTFKMLNNIRLNLHSQPCLDPDKYKRCQDDCYRKKIYNIIPCKLPFLDNINKDNCTNAKDALTSMALFMNSSFKIDLMKDCGCHQPCEESVFDTFVYFQHPESWSLRVLAIIPMNNIIEEITQILSYNGVALCCDIGNCFALMLGLSILAIPELLQKFFFQYLN